MKILSAIRSSASMSLLSVIFIAIMALLFVPAIVGVSLVLMGVEMDWGSFKTYVGIALITWAILGT